MIKKEYKSEDDFHGKIRGLSIAQCSSGYRQKIMIMLVWVNGLLHHYLSKNIKFEGKNATVSPKYENITTLTWRLALTREYYGILQRQQEWNRSNM